MRYIFIINSLSKSNYLKNLNEAIAAVDSELRLRIELKFTEYPGHAKDMAVEVAEKFGSNVAIVVCGGDGTVHEVANALVHRNTPLIVFPFGTGNDFVRSIFPFSNRNNIKYMLENLDNMAFYPIDLIRIDSYDILGAHLSNWSSYCNNIASIGLDTVVQAKAKARVRARNNWFNSKTSYIFSALNAVFHCRSFKLAYQLELCNGEIIESTNDEFTLISICNGQYYGNGFRPAPNAVLDDGVIDVCVVDKVSVFKAFYLLALYKLGKHEGKNGIHTYKCTSGTITSGAESYQILGNYDGEDFYGHRIRFEVFQGALTVGFIEKYNPLSAKEKNEIHSSLSQEDHVDLNKINPHGVLSIEDSVQLMSKLTKSLSVDWDDDVNDKNEELENTSASEEEVSELIPVEDRCGSGLSNFRNKLNDIVNETNDGLGVSKDTSDTEE